MHLEVCTWLLHYLTLYGISNYNEIQHNCSVTSKSKKHVVNNIGKNELSKKSMKPKSNCRHQMNIFIIAECEIIYTNISTLVHPKI